MDAAPPEPRRRRRAVGPPGAVRGGGEPLPALLDPPEADAGPEAGEDERLRADRPPHHDRGV